LRMIAQGVPLRPISLYPFDGSGFRHLLDTDPPAPISRADLPAEGWTNFYRSDDVSAVAYFYLDRPENGLPPLAPVQDRVAALRPPPVKLP